MKKIQDIIDLLDASLIEDGETNIMWGNIIQLGYDKEIDTYRNLIEDSHRWLSEYQKGLVEKLQITTLKIKYTNASGYFIEVPKSQISKVPDSFTHKQTLVNAGRFVTLELVEFGSQLLEAQNNMAEKEYEIFQDIRAKILTQYSLMKQASKNISVVDFISSLWEVSYSSGYVCPKITESYRLSIKEWRHPVIEGIEKSFISNNLTLMRNDFTHIITGPNMGWKSTFLRQNALLLVMAHIGSYIPAQEAEIGLVDKIFSRVGAHDNLFFWKSTFMVEMQEVANILNNATEKSFIIIDEVGRGTSTYDGMSLAWSILRHIHDKLKTKTLFATHYHEIIDESVTLKNASNHSVAVGENEENLVFLRKIIPWGIKKSYGLEVAKIAGIEKDIILEAERMSQSQKYGTLKWVGQLSLWEEIEDHELPSQLEKHLLSLNIDDITPLEAINELSRLKKLTKK